MSTLKDFLKKMKTHNTIAANISPWIHANQLYMRGEEVADESRRTMQREQI